MPARIVFSLLMLLSTAASLPAAELRGTCEVRFDAAATFNDFSGTGRCAPFSAPLQRGPDGHVRVPLVEIEVPVEGMKTGIDGRDRDMREMLQTDRHPAIRGSVRDLDIDAVRQRLREDPGGKAQFGITLSIRGVERQIPAFVSGLKEEGNRASFDIDFPVSLKDFGIEAPRVFVFVRVEDAVSVKTSFAVEMTEGAQ